MRSPISLNSLTHNQIAVRVASATHLLSCFPGIEITIDQYLTESQEKLDAKWPTVRLLPGVQRLIQHLVKHNVPIVVATASSRRNFDRKSENLKDFFDCFQGNIVCADDVAGKTTGKPDPYIFLHAAGVLGKAVGVTEQCTEAEAEERSKGLVFEDAVYGVQAGKRAGMPGRVLFQSRDLASRSLQLSGYLTNAFWTWLVLAHTSQMRRSRPSSISSRRNGGFHLMTLAFRGEPLHSGLYPKCEDMSPFQPDSQMDIEHYRARKGTAIHVDHSLSVP